MKVHQEPEEFMARQNIERRIAKAMKENADINHIIRDVLTAEFVCSRPEFKPEEFKKIFELVYNSDNLENYFSTLRGIIFKIITSMQFMHDDSSDYDTFSSAIADEVTKSEEFSNLVEDFTIITEADYADIETEDVVRYIIISIVITSLSAFRSEEIIEEAPSQLGDFQKFINRQNVGETSPTTAANAEERIDMSEEIYHQPKVIKFAEGHKAHAVKPKNKVVVEASASTSTDNKPIEFTTEEIDAIKDKLVEAFNKFESTSSVSGVDIKGVLSSIVDRFIDNKNKIVDGDYAIIIITDCLTGIKDIATRVIFMKTVIEMFENRTFDKICESVFAARSTQTMVKDETEPVKKLEPTPVSKDTVDDEPIKPSEKKHEPTSIPEAEPVNNTEKTPKPTTSLKDKFEGVKYDDNGMIIDTGKMSIVNIIMNKDRIEKSAYNKAHRTHIRLMCGFN